jgi:TPR repeat protein
MTAEVLNAPAEVIPLRLPSGVKERWAISQQRYEAGDQKSALEIMESIASEGYVEAYVELGNLYEIAKEYERSATWYQRAVASLDEPFAHARLGALYFNGLGVPRDRAKAFQHLSKGESLRWPHTLLMLGVLFYFGAGTEVNRDRARSLYREAADAGLVLAMHYLSSVEAENGHYLQAAKWRIRAVFSTIKALASGDPEQRLVGVREP